MTETRAAIYLRISSDPTGQQLGVTRQREDCLKLCAARGWTSVEYVDNDVSASSGKKRPAYGRMIEDVRDGRIGAVVAWDLDRLHRRPIELEAFMALADDRNLALATVSGDIDLGTAQGRMMARMKGAVAAHEIEHKRARQLRAAKQKAEQGRPQWKRAFGYADDTHQPDAVTAPLVREAYAAVLAGGSISDIARAWNKAAAYGLTGRPWSASTVSLFLRAPRNAGLRDHNGEIVGKGTWPPLVDEQTWRAVQAVLNAPGRAPGRKTVRKHLLTGVLRCGKAGCGGYLSGQWVMLHPTGRKPGRRKAGEPLGPPTGQVGHRITYACKTCRGCSVRAEHVEPLVYKAIGGRLARPDAVDLLKAEVHDVTEAEALRVERLALLTRLDEIADERADGLLTGQQAQRATARINDKLEAIEQQQQDAERLRVFDGLPLGRPEVAEAVKELTPDRLRAVIDVLVEFVIAPVGKGGKTFKPDRVAINWRGHAEPNGDKG
ncbi:recombinase family protein [Mycobacterium intracellulare]|uniref:recombinase family protein n=1 Tax=Mycobacterium intracellulare TaxID=1767 RepID=UPI0012DB1A71|nr:recombinase family protein [Mycobacterium intracellulare]